jgi:hypothetical protein
MSRADSPQRPDSGCELEPVTCWPLIYAAGGVVVLGVIVTAGLFAFDWLRPAPAPVAAAALPARAVEESTSAVTRDPGDLAPLVRRSAERVVSVKRVVVGGYVPMPPRPPRIEEVHTPRIVAQKKEERSPIPRLVRKRSAQPGPGAPSSRTESYLRDLLVKQSREIDLETVEGTGKALLEEGKNRVAAREAAKRTPSTKEEPGPSISAALERLVAKRADLKGLPLLAGSACRMSTEQARVFGVLSPKVRRVQALAERRRATETKRESPVPSYPYPHPYEAREPETVLPSAADKVLVETLTATLSLPRIKEKHLLVRPLEQMYQTEPTAVRIELVKTLGKIPGSESTQALARRAVYDLSPRAREAAVKALKGRNRDEARPVFLTGLRHRWAPAADHAALALVALEDDEAVPELRELLDEPDPAAPYRNEDGKWVQKELVRVNHLRNCLLCHAPSVDDKVIVSGPIPTPGKPLPIVYYGGRPSTQPSVRADVVYFRQDFSAMHPVDKPNRWPAVQRFDYLVRTRELDPDEAAEAARKVRGSYPQRDALLYALSKLNAIEQAEPRRRSRK